MGRTKEEIEEQLEEEHRKELTENINHNVDIWNSKSEEEQLAVVEDMKVKTGGKFDFTNFIGKKITKIKGVL